MQTIQQERAKYALHCVKTDAEKEISKSEYKSYAASLPAMIHMNGLGQAMAFYYSKGKTHKYLYDLLSNWLCKDSQPYGGYNDLLDGIVNGDMHSYRLAQAESQALMDWVKKFAKAYM